MSKTGSPSGARLTPLPTQKLIQHPGIPGGSVSSYNVGPLEGGHLPVEPIKQNSATKNRGLRIYRPSSKIEQYKNERMAKSGKREDSDERWGSMGESIFIRSRFHHQPGRGSDSRRHWSSRVDRQNQIRHQQSQIRHQ